MSSVLPSAVLAPRCMLHRPGSQNHEEFCEPIFLSAARPTAEHNQSWLETFALEVRWSRVRARATQRHGSQTWPRDRDIHLDARGPPGMDAHGDQRILVGRRREQSVEEPALGPGNKRPARRYLFVVADTGSGTRSRTHAAHN